MWPSGEPRLHQPLKQLNSGYPTVGYFKLLLQSAVFSPVEQARGIHVTGRGLAVGL